MKKIRILHLISSLNRGGAETVLATLLEEWKESIYEHRVIYFHDGPLRERIERLGIKTIHVKGFFCLYDPLFMIRLGAAILTIRPTIIYSSLWAANFLGRISGWCLGIPCVCAVHAVAAHEGKIRNLLDRWCPVNATYYVAVSISIKESLVNDLLFPAQRVEYIPNGITVKDQGAVMITRKQLWGEISENFFIIGTVGRLVPVKNYDLLIQAFALIAERYSYARLMIVGYGPEEQRLKKLVNNLGMSEKVFFIVNQPAAAYYSLFDAFVQPSSYEGLSIALLEALSKGLPVIVTGDKGAHEVVEHNRTGLIIDPKMESIVEALSIMLEKSPHERKVMGIKGRDHVNALYSSKGMVAAYKQFMDRLIDRSLYYE